MWQLINIQIAVCSTKIYTYEIFEIQFNRILCFLPDSIRRWADKEYFNHISFYEVWTFVKESIILVLYGVPRKPNPMVRFHS